MSYAYKCDRCGTFFEDREHEKEIKYRVYTNNQVWSDTVLMFCKDCSAEADDILELWIKCGKPKNQCQCQRIETPACDHKKRWWKGAKKDGNNV